MGGTPSPWAPVRVTRESEPVQRRGRRGRLRFPEHAAANRTCHLAACGRLPGDAEEGVGTSQAGPQEADCVCRGSPGWPAVCRHHTPCVSLREARWPFLLHFLQFYSQGAWRLRTGPAGSPPPMCPLCRGRGCSQPQHCLRVFERDLALFSHKPMGSGSSRLLCAGPSPCGGMVLSPGDRQGHPGTEHMGTPAPVASHPS